MYKQLLFALAALTAGSAAAQERRDPADAKAKAPPVEYRSAFESYRPYAEPELASWRAVNEEVRSAGGHVGLMRGQGQEKPPAKPAAKPPAPGGGK
jgi:hypothetical protein